MDREGEGEGEGEGGGSGRAPCLWASTHEAEFAGLSTNASKGETMQSTDLDEPAVSLGVAAGRCVGDLPLQKRPARVWTVAVAGRELRVRLGLGSGRVSKVVAPWEEARHSGYNSSSG